MRKINEPSEAGSRQRNRCQPEVGYNGDLTSREAGYVGGYMVKKMIEQVERAHLGK